MSPELEALFNEDYNTKHAEIYKDYSVEELEAEIKKTEAYMKERMRNGEVLASGGMVHIPGNIKMQVLKSLLRHKKGDQDPLKDMFRITPQTKEEKTEIERGL